MSSQIRTTQCMEDIIELINRKYPEVYLANLEVWDKEGFQKQKTKLKYKEWYLRELKKKLKREREAAFTEARKARSDDLENIARKKFYKAR
jgi:hypothetical protein